MVYDDLICIKGDVKMENEKIERREIKKVWTVNEQKVSPIHRRSGTCTWGLKSMILFYY